MSASALAVANIQMLAQGAGTQENQVGFAAVGLGSISNIFMRGCAASQAAKVTGLVTGHPDTQGQRYGQMYAVPERSIYTYETFDRIRDNKDIEAVYIGLPNSMHCEFTVRAAQAGKHVLCEKPMAISSAECRRMIDACKSAGVKLMIAYRVHYDPTHLQAQQLIQTGAIGEVQAFEGAFGFNATPNQWRLVRKLAGGGSLLDVGIYPLNESRWLTGEEPVLFTAMPTTRDKTSGRFSEIEQTLDFTVKFPSGIVGAYACTYGSDMPGFLRIHGDRGTLELSPAYNYTGTHLRSAGGRQRVDTLSSESDISYQFRLEAEYFAQCVRTGTEPKTPGEEGLKDMLAIEAIYRAAGTPIG